MAALLHDIVDDSEATLAEVEAAFGGAVAGLVGAVAQLSRNNQLLRRAHRRMVAQGQHVRAAAEVEAMKSMILQSTEEPLVRCARMLALRGRVASTFRCHFAHCRARRSMEATGVWHRTRHRGQAPQRPPATCELNFGEGL